MAMGAILGIAAFGRTQEKLAGANNGGIASTVSAAPTAPMPIAQTGVSPFTSTQVASVQPGITFSSTGKAMPEQPPQPVI